MIGAIWAWLTDPTSWSGTGGIGARLVEHVRYTLIVIALPAAVAIPLGLFVGHTGRGRWLVTGANAARAVPTLGLLFGLSLWLGPRLHSDLAFSLPSIVVLVVLAIPPILAGAYAGVESVDPAARDAATGMGMGPGEVLRRVEIPIALPLLLSGLRAAPMQVIATATIAAYVGLGGLGRYLVDGLAAGQYDVTAGGALLVSGLALLVDVLWAGAARGLVSPGLVASGPVRPGRTGKDHRARGVVTPTTAQAGG